MLLEKQIFQNIIDNAPLISIDLIIKNHLGKVLLGKRKNPPAQDYWFVPGGRIRKNETFEQAFTRLTLQELGQSLSLKEAVFLAPYQHFYIDSMFDGQISTHYVVLAYQLTIDGNLLNLPFEQHHCYKWFDVDELLSNQQVHPFTKDYFNNKDN